MKLRSAYAFQLGVDLLAFRVVSIIAAAEATAANTAQLLVQNDKNQPDAKKRELLSDRIIGGTQAVLGEYPFFVDWNRRQCGASLIWADVILSAAHCDVVTSNEVLVGAYQDWVATDTAVFRTITQRVVHPKFDNNTFNYDFLVMKLDSSVPSSITPVNLNGFSNYPATNQLLTVIGLGTTTQGGSEAVFLQKVSVPCVDTATCGSELGETLNSSLELCAGATGRDSCQGDSGGPLLDAYNVQVGIVSYGEGCGLQYKPGVYSRLSGAIGWITQQVCALSSNPPPTCTGVTNPIPTPVKVPTPPPVKYPNPPPIRPSPYFTPPQTPAPTLSPTHTVVPVGGTLSPSIFPTHKPTKKPTLRPTSIPTAKPTSKPTSTPTSKPTPKPTTSTAVKPSVSTTINVPAGYCFSEANTVEVEGKGNVAIKDLRIGDKVLGSTGEMTTVYSFGHYKQQIEAEYLQIHTSGLAIPLELSKDHMLFVNGVAVPASTLSVGDKMDTIHGHASAEIKKIRSIKRRGAYAPFTTSGTITMSGIAASSFVSLQDNSSVLIVGHFKTSLSWQWLAHVFESPHRLVCTWSINYCRAETYSDEGISKWVKAPLHFSQWLIQQNVVVVTSLLCPAILLWLVLFVVEVSYRYSWVLALVALMALFCQSDKPSKCKSD